MLSYRSLSFVCLAAFMLPVSAFESPQDEKSVRSTELKEVVVKGDRFRIEGDRMIFIPRKREKNLSRDAISLVERMNMGIIRVDDGEIKTSNGKKVTVFINGIKADEVDMSTFWPQNVERVEYMESSDNPMFQGYSNIINFVVKEYVAGGLTKLDGDQKIPNDGKYSVASKLVYGKMTYNALFSGGYSRNRQNGSSKTESFNDIFYDGKFYDNITRYEDSDDIICSNNLYGGINARYRTDRFIMTHSLAIQWNENPGSESSGSLSYHPSVIDSDRMMSESGSRSLSPLLSGYYFYNPGKKWSIGGGWHLSHSHNNLNASYRDIGSLLIANDTRENIYGYGMSLNFNYNFRPNMVFQTTLKGNRNVSKAEYSGSAQSVQRQNDGAAQLEILWWYQPVRFLTFSVKPQISIDDWKVNDMERNYKWMPGVNAAVLWSINRKNSATFSSWYYQKTPASAYRNNVILRRTDLMWIEGNPDISASHSYWLSLEYNSNSFDWMRNTVSLSMINESNTAMMEYRSGGIEYDGIIGRYISQGNIRNYKAQWSVGFSLFGGDLNIGNQLTFDYRTASNGKHIKCLRTRPYVSWYFGNCSLGINYGTPEKYFSNGGMETIRTSHYYGLNFSYGNGNFLLDISLDEPFEKHLVSYRTYYGDSYVFDCTNRKNGRSLTLSLSYTFDYGKKISPGIEISEQNLRSTSVISTE